MANIVQWNIRGLRANYSELELLISTFRPVAFCLQELLITDTYTFPNRQYTLQKSLPATDSNARPSGGAGVLVRNDIPHSIITFKSNLQAVACRLSVPEPVTVCSVYLPPTSSWNYTDLLSLVSNLPSPVILMGDFNSHSTLWGCSSTNQKGLEIETFLLQSNLCLLNNKSPTYLHPATGSLSSLDLALCDPSLFINYKWSVHDDLCGSDHYPIVLSQSNNKPVTNIKQWKLKSADWTTFAEMCSNDLHGSADNTIEDFTTKLNEIAHKTIPKTSGKLAMRQRPWFNDDCKLAITNRQKALNKYLADPNQSNLDTFRIFRAKARRTIKTCKRDSWRSYVSKLNNSTPSKKVWEMVKRISGKHQPTGIHHLVVNNNKIENPQDIANAIASQLAYNSSAKHLTKNFQKFKTQQEKNPIRLQSDNTEPYNQPFSATELHDALHHAHDTAVGPDDIHYQMLKHLPETSQSYLLEIFNDIWKTGYFPPSWTESTIIPLPKPDKDHTSPNSYRPLALTSCICKTLERMVSNRLTWYLETNKILSEIQCGFRKQRNTIDQLIRLESFVR